MEDNYYLKEGKTEYSLFLAIGCFFSVQEARTRRKEKRTRDAHFADAKAATDDCHDESTENRRKNPFSINDNLTLSTSHVITSATLLPERVFRMDDG